MMRRFVCAIALLSAAALPAAAQMPPSITKPIEAAKRQANRTSDQINNEQKVGNAAPSRRGGPVVASCLRGHKP